MNNCLSGMKLRWFVVGRDGFPVEKVRGRPILNLFRVLVHGRGLRRYWARKTGRAMFEIHGPFPSKLDDE